MPPISKRERVEEAHTAHGARVTTRVSTVTDYATVAEAQIHDGYVVVSVGPPAESNPILGGGTILLSPAAACHFAARLVALAATLAAPQTLADEPQRPGGQSARNEGSEPSAQEVDYLGRREDPRPESSPAHLVSIAAPSSPPAPIQPPASTQVARPFGPSKVTASCGLTGDLISPRPPEGEAT